MEDVFTVTVIEREEFNIDISIKQVSLQSESRVMLEGLTVLLVAAVNIDMA